VLQFVADLSNYPINNNTLSLSNIDLKFNIRHNFFIDIQIVYIMKLFHIVVNCLKAFRDGTLLVIQCVRKSC